MPRLRVTPTRRALGAVALFLLVATVPPRSSRLLDVFLAALAAAVAVALLRALAALRRLRCERDLPGTGVRGESLPLVLRVVNDSGAAAFALGVEEQGVGHAASVAFFPAVPAAGSAEVRGRLRLAERGFLRLTAVRLFASDPFGLFRASRVARLEGEVLVQPRPRRLAARRLLDEARSAHATGARGARHRPSTETAFVRDYRPGDSPRTVHWPLSAHRGTLVVRTFVEERPKEALIVLDRGLPSASPRDLAAFERAVALAAGLGVEVMERGGEVALVATGEPPLALERLRGRAGRSALLSALALVKPEIRGDGELPPLDARARDAYVFSARTVPASALPEGAKLRVVRTEGGPGPASSAAVARRPGAGGRPGRAP